jgi:predicted HTH transcriptional regulator
LKTFKNDLLLDNFLKMQPRESYIKGLISQGEHQMLDFKYEISDAMKMAKTFSSFANTDGGILLIGVKDNGKIKGVRTDEEYYMAESSAKIYCRPEVPFTAEKWIVDGKTVLEIRIPSSDKKPHYAMDREDKWQAYVRVSDENLVANPVLLKVWKMKKSRKGVLIQYSKHEKHLMEYLSKHLEISLLRFAFISRLKESEAEDILARLISFGIIKMQISVEKITYRLTERGLLVEENQFKI